MVDGPRVLLYSATPRADRGGVQRMMADLEDVLPTHGLSVRRAGPDETPDTGGLTFAANTDAGADGRPAMAALPGAGRALLQLAGLLRRVRPDVVNVHFITGEVVYFLVLRRLFGFRLILSAHGGDLLRPTPQIRSHLPRLLRAADAVTTVSGELSRTVRDIGGDGMVLHEIPNGVDTAFWSPSPSSEPGSGPGPRSVLESDLNAPHRLVAAGRLLPIKGFDVLIAAMAQLSQARLRIMGEGAKRTDLQARIDAAGLSDRIALTGHASREEMRAAFRDAQVFVMPSRGEGMPLVLLEALACGCPAVATPVGAIPDVLDDGSGRIVPVDDPDALARTLGGVLAGEAGPTRAGARARAKMFTQEACYAAYADLIRACVGPG